jgi:sigma-B regulation protein RsbU (phosphoserine phosphatase)
MENFLKLVKQNRTLAPERIIDLVYRNVTSFSGSELQYDDFTMLVSRLSIDTSETVRKMFQYPAVPESVPRLRDDLSRVLVTCGIQGELLEDLLLVSDEAATNIVLHAFEQKQSTSSIFNCKVNVRVGDEIKLEFRDQGKPFNIEEVRQPDVRENLAGRRKGGFGVYLIRTLTDSVDYARTAGENVLRILKKL